jgi:hypothetical protein
MFDDEDAIVSHTTVPTALATRGRAVRNGRPYRDRPMRSRGRCTGAGTHICWSQVKKLQRIRSWTPKSAAFEMISKRCWLAISRSMSFK